MTIFKFKFKLPKLLFIYSFVIVPIVIVSSLLEMSGKVCTSYEGFAIDSRENIYLGKDSEIQVLDPEGMEIRSINPKTTRGYRFTITENNTLLLSTGEYLYTMDIFGNVLSEKKINDYTQDPFTRFNSSRFKATDGTAYIMRNTFLRPCIYSIDGKQQIKIYEMPNFDYVVKLMNIIFVACTVIILPICLFQAIKKYWYINQWSNKK